MLQPTPIHCHLLPFTRNQSHPVPSNPTQSNPLPPIPTHFDSFLTQSHLFSEHSHQLWLIFSHIKPIFSVYFMSICLTYLINLPGAILNCANTHSNPLPFIVIRAHPLSFICSSLPAHYHSCLNLSNSF